MIPKTWKEVTELAKGAVKSKLAGWVLNVLLRRCWPYLLKYGLPVLASIPFLKEYV